MGPTQTELDARAERFPLGATVTLARLAREHEQLTAQLRAEEPVTWCPDAGSWLVAPRAIVDEVIRDAERFTPDDDRNSDRLVLGRTMLTTDGPDHELHRRPFDASLRVGHVRSQYTDVVDRCVDIVLSEVAADGAADVMGQVAEPLGIRVVGDVLGFGYPDTRALKALLEQLGEAMLFDQGADVRAKAFAVREEFAKEVVGLLHHARETAPESVLGVVAREHPGDLDETIIVNNTLNLIFGGAETTASLAGTGLWALLSHPDQLAEVREDRELIPRAIDEAARLHAPFGTTLRWAKQDVELGGVEIPAGDRIYPLMMAANRDPAMFDDPERYDVRRKNARRYVTFGRGLHFCIGQNLAQLAAQRLMDAVLTRLPDLRLDPERPSKPTGFEFYRLPRLDVLWDAEGAR